MSKPLINTLGARLGFRLGLICTLSVPVLSGIGALAWAEDAESPHPRINSLTVDPSHYDWVAYEHLPPELQAQVSQACRGTYVDPLAGADGLDALEDLPLEVEADRTHMSADEIQLLGSVTVSQGPRQIQAGAMLYDRAKGTAALADKVEIRQPGMVVRGDSAQVNMASQHARFDGGDFVLHNEHLRGSAGSIEHQGNGVVVLRDGKLTSCEPGRESWAVRGKRLRLNPETRQGSGRGVIIEVAGIPMLYAPYIAFPLGGERQSGLLAPSLGTSNSGVDITLPWYWNLAPNYDATLAPRYASGHGAMLETEWRYLNRYSLNALNLAWLSNDKGGNDPNPDDLIADLAPEFGRVYRGEDRWLFGLEHRGGDTSRWFTDIEYARVSDVDYFRDLSPESFELSNSTHLNQSATVGYRLDHWDLSARFQGFQSLLLDIDPSYRQLPRVQMNGRYRWDRWGLTLAHEWVNFQHVDDAFVTGRRINTDYQLEWYQHWLWGYARPKVGVQALAYQLDQRNLLDDADDAPRLHAPYAALDTGLIFERHNGRHTLEPRLFYLYRAHADHDALFGVTADGRNINFDTTLLTFSYDQLFRERRFAGGDRLGDANQVSIGITSQWLDRDLSRTRASISVGQVIYFSDRDVTLNPQDQTQTIQQSDLASKVMARVSDTLRLRGDFLYNARSERMMRASTGLEYQDEQRRHLMLGYRYVREDQLEQATLAVDQLDTAFVVPFGDQWQLIGRLFFDLDRGRELDAFMGFEYDDCCYRVRFLARRWLDSKLAALVSDERRHYDTGIMLEVDFKGLASSSNRIQQLLGEVIPGFRE